MGDTVQSIAGPLCCQARGTASLMLGGGSLQSGEVGRESPRRTQRQPKAKRVFPRAGYAEGTSVVDWKSSGIPRSWQTQNGSFLEENPGL